MTSFKFGDRVVRVTGVYTAPGTRATIIQKDKRYTEDWLVETDESVLTNWHKDAFVTEVIYDSPLFKLMQETDQDIT